MEFSKILLVVVLIELHLAQIHEMFVLDNKEYVSLFMLMHVVWYQQSQPSHCIPASLSRTSLPQTKHYSMFVLVLLGPGFGWQSDDCAIDKAHR